jgi:hypothetical protein
MTQESAERVATRLSTREVLGGVWNICQELNLNPSDRVAITPSEGRNEFYSVSFFVRPANPEESPTPEGKALVVYPRLINSRYLDDLEEFARAAGTERENAQAASEISFSFGQGQAKLLAQQPEIILSGNGSSEATASLHDWERIGRMLDGIEKPLNTDNATIEVFSQEGSPSS